MCGSGPRWKREEVPDHKFDFVDTREFTDNGCAMRMKYLWIYVLVLKSFLVYVSDIFTAITMLSTDAWSNQIFQNCATQQSDSEENTDGAECVFIPFAVGKWLFVGCIIFSFLLLAYEARKSKKIIASRDISFAFTNDMANHYYSLRSYDHFCFFDHISNSTKTSDDFAFFVFFTFKSWKRLLLADGPRQTINALTLYAIYLSKRNEPGDWYEIPKYFKGNTLSTTALTISSVFTVVIFVGSLLLLIVAAICYIPLLCHIRGNLKEYCCHKVDKRIGTVIKRRQKRRLADATKLAQKEAEGDYSHLKNKKGEIVHKPLPQPTLPNLSVDDDFDDRSSIHTRKQAPSTYTSSDQYYYNSDKGDFPPMPAYSPYTHHQTPSYPNINPSVPSFSQDDHNYQQNQFYDDDNASTTHLTASAAPLAQQSPEQQYYYSQNAPYNPHDIYTGRAPSAQGNRPSNLHDTYTVRAPSAQGNRPSSGNNSALAYESGHTQTHSTHSNAAYAPRQQAQTGRGYDEENGRAM